MLRSNNYFVSSDQNRGARDLIIMLKFLACLELFGIFIKLLPNLLFFSGRYKKWPTSGVSSIEVFGYNHRHLRNIDYVTVHTACLVCFISTVNGRSKRRKKRSLLWAELVEGTQRNLSSLYYLDVYGYNCPVLFSISQFFIFHSLLTKIVQNRGPVL